MQSINYNLEDCNRLVDEHFIFACDTLILHLAHIINKALHERFPTSWTKHIILQSFKSEVPILESEL